ncbi:TRAP transporter small permease [Roseovarius sp. SYSU LYC5161]|uniref:TRAP transporter small permease n=1 Tax=Roseovarius halophilus (ex Wu et al. 2025) TaxID=3376060 RepID=UPI00399BDC28
MQRLLSLIDWISQALAVLSGLMIAVIALLVSTEIMLRNLFGHSLSFVWEVSVYFQMCAIFLASAWTLRTGGHIRVTLVQTAMPRAFEWLATLVGLAISAVLSNALVQLAWRYGTSGRSSGSTSDIALVYPAAAMAVGAVLLTIQIALRLLRLGLGMAPELEVTGEEQTAPNMD